MTLSDLGEGLLKIDAELDKYRDDIPADLYKSISAEVNKLLRLAMDAVYERYADKIADECAQDVLDYLKSANNEAD